MFTLSTLPKGLRPVVVLLPIIIIGGLVSQKSWPCFFCLDDPTERTLAQEAQNSTLGFGNIFYISLPYRSDRQDAIELTAAATSLSLTHQPGVNGSIIHEKARPEGTASFGPGHIGCWRSHADTWRRVVKENLLTALIIEDDADWDINVHDIFEELSRQMQKGVIRSQPPSDHESLVAPYGYDWDVLWVGSCWDTANWEHRPQSQIYNDMNAPSRGQMTAHFIREMEAWGAQVTDEKRQRVLAPAWAPVCTVGYAVTRKGAAKLLYETSMRGMSAPIDLTMATMGQNGMIKAYTVNPPLINPILAKDRTDSDINSAVNNHPITEHVWERKSENLRRSARAVVNEMRGGIIR